MRNALVLCLTCGFLSACGDPLADVERISDVEILPSEPVRDVAAAPETVAEREGFFAGLFKRAEPVEAATAEVPDPIADENAVEVTAASDGTEENVSDDASDAVAEGGETVAPQPERRGFLGFLRPKSTSGNGTISPEQSTALVETPEKAELVEGEPTNVANAPAVSTEKSTDVAAVDTAAADTEAKPRRRGLLAFLRGHEGAAEEDLASSAAPEAPQAEASVQVASLDSAAAETRPDRVQPAAKERRGLFALLSPKARRESANEAVVIDPDQEIPYGNVARACNATAQDMGKRIEQAGQGRGYALYDSNPGATIPRPFYVTGFSDGCPRIFTAALALFGAPSMHEQLRYGRPSEQYPYSATDKAYEKVKGTICRVSRREPCGSKIGVLERNTVFISTYERFTDNGRWSDILIHDGEVLATAIKNP